MNLEVVLGIIEESLVLINKLVPDQATKIQKEINEIRSAWNEEYAKGNKRDDNMLILLEMRFNDLRKLLSSTITEANTKIKP